MRYSLLLTLFAGACSVCANTLRARRNYETHDYYALHLDSSASPVELAQHLGLHHEGQLGPLDDHHVFSAPKHQNDIVEDSIQELRKRRRRKRDAALEPHILDSVLLNQKQSLKKRLVKRGVIPTLETRADAKQLAVAERAQV